MNKLSSTPTTAFADYSGIESLPEMWPIAAKQYEDIVALYDPHAQPEVTLTYTQLWEKIQQFATGLQALGIEAESKVALIADNNPRWMIADQGIITAGAVDVVRSSSAERQELLYIIGDSDSTAIVVENLKTLNKLIPELDDLPISLVVLLSDEQPEAQTNIKILNFEQLLAAGSEHSLKPTKQNKQTLATLMYTSGTTGKPKGVMLSHGNLLHQVQNLPSVIPPDRPGQLILSILPIWHVYERTAEYFLLSLGGTQIYTNIRSFKKDLQKHQPQYMIGVPRLWESIYEGVRKQFREQPASKQKLAYFFLNVSERYITARRTAQRLNLENLNPSATERLLASIIATLLRPIHLLGDRLVYKKIRQATGGKLKTVISGGGALSVNLDNFYEIIGINVLVGYGLTETSPVTHARRLHHNLRGSAGLPLADTEVCIVDPETRSTLPTGKQGLVLLRGPQIMQGYYKKPEATAKAIDSEGWFDSGDLGRLTSTNDLVLTGRAKDTIVLTNGENIEPQPIEDACARSAFIDQIMLVGQDQRSLGALIVPNLEALETWAQQQQISLQLPSSDVSREEINKSDLYSQPVVNLFRQELNREVKNRPGYRADDRIGQFELILEPFSQENGMMTQTLKIKRPVVRERYRDIVDGMFQK